MGIGGGKKQTNMKRMLIVCLLGMGLLLPSTNSTANGFSKRIVDVYIEGMALRCTSDVNTGGITLVEIFNSSNVKVRQQTYDIPGYSVSVNISILGSGSYTAKVTTTLTTYTEGFSI